MENYPWMWVPTFNFFGGLLPLALGLSTGQRSMTFIGVFLCTTCLGLGWLMHKCGMRWS